MTEDSNTLLPVSQAARELLREAGDYALDLRELAAQWSSYGQAGRAKHLTAAADMIDRLATQEPTPSTERELLLEATEQLRRVIGDHFAPNDCYATGPLTGNAYTDLVSCPSCEGERLLERLDTYLTTQEPALDLHTLDPTEWQSMDSAPKDGTLVELVVDYSDGGGPLHDARLSPTIGFNNLSNTDEDKWQFAGWSWEQDCFCEGSGIPIAWRPSRLNSYDEGLPPMPDGALKGGAQ